MHQCNFCHDMFMSRPQVKEAKACSKCQGLRRRANQKAWHSKHKTGFDRDYHRLQRDHRNKQLKALCCVLCDALKIGLRFQGKQLNSPFADDLFLTFLEKIGIRRANNLWTFLTESN